MILGYDRELARTPRSLVYFYARLVPEMGMKGMIRGLPPLLIPLVPAAKTLLH
jgi:hypothetical protein